MTEDNGFCDFEADSWVAGAKIFSNTSAKSSERTLVSLTAEEERALNSARILSDLISKKYT